MSNELNEVDVEENVVLAKYEGDSTDEQDMIERIVVQNGTVVEHNAYEAGKDLGPVEESELLGKEVGRLLSDNL